MIIYFCKSLLAEASPVEVLLEFVAAASRAWLTDLISDVKESEQNEPGQWEPLQLRLNCYFMNHVNF